jgi:thiazole synthase
MSQMTEAVKASGSELVTMALKRIDHQSDSDDLLTALQLPDVHLLPNTSGARNAQELYWQHNWQEKLWKQTG